MAKARTGSGRSTTTDDEDDGEAEGDGALDDRINGIVNKAVSAQLSRRLPNMITQAMSGPLDEIRGLLSSGTGRTGARRADDEEVEDQPARRRGGARPAARSARHADDEETDEQPARPDPEVAKLRKKLEGMEVQQRQTMQAARERERDADIRDQLTNAGVDKNRMRGAVAVIASQAKWDEKKNAWLYPITRDGVDEDIDLSAGVSEWVGTDEGKSYVAAPAGHQFNGGAPVSRLRNGAGTRIQAGAGAARSAPQPGSKEAKAAKVQAARDGLRAGIDQVSAGVDSEG